MRQRRPFSSSKSSLLVSPIFRLRHCPLPFIARSGELPQRLAPRACSDRVRHGRRSTFKVIAFYYKPPRPSSPLRTSSRPALEYLRLRLSTFLFFRRATYHTPSRRSSHTRQISEMSHAASPEEVLHRTHRVHYPNHRHAIPLRPILHRRTTTSHLGRQPPARTQGAPLSPISIVQLFTSLLSPSSIIDAEEFRCLKAQR